MTHAQTLTRRLQAILSLAAGAVALFAGSAHAAVPGITGGTGTPVFNLVASAEYTSQPDGAALYTWGYGCLSAPASFVGVTAAQGATCPTMQMPGPTMVVTEGDVVTVTLTDSLPRAAGNTSIVFPGFSVTATGGAAGLIAQEATPGSPVVYQFTATKPGTYAYYSGTQPDLQIEMGLYGAIIVLPKNAPSTCPAASSASLSNAAYDHPDTCYDREYLFQFAEQNANVHQAADDGQNGPPGSLNFQTSPYQPQYFLVNGRSMPDDMDASYAPSYPHQPYNGNPHMHPGERMLMRIIEQGRQQHPFHFHGNHARVIARDGNLLLSTDASNALAGPLLFTTPVVPGQTQDQIFTWTGQGLNWDVYGRTQVHVCNGVDLPTAIANLTKVTPAETAVGLQLAGKAGGATSPFDPVTKEWCPDHGKDIPVAPPDPQAVANGLWYGGTPYLGLQSTVNPTPLPPGAVKQNPDAGYAYMWHSHNEREITTNNVFPGGLMMMLIVDPPTSTIDESK